MSRADVIRAWKDVEYRASLSASEIDMLPAHPAGLVEISDADLGGVAGGSDDGITIFSVNFCMTITVCVTVTFCITTLTPVTVTV